MASLDEKRRRIKELVLGVVKRMDNDKGLNYKRYSEMFEVFEKDDAAFEEWVSGIGHELDDTIQIFALPFEEPKMHQIKAAADFLKLPLEEYMYYRHHDPRGIRTKMRVPIGYVHIKRVQQILSKKNHYSFDNEETELKSGQVKGESKVASMSDPESFSLTAIGADRALEELLGPRSDNYGKKNDMYRQIVKYGYCSLDELEEDRSKSTALNTLNTYLLASGIRSDLIVNSLKTHYTIEKDIRNK